MLMKMLTRQVKQPSQLMDLAGKKSTKRKAETKNSADVIVTGNETAKPACEVHMDDEDIIVDIVGMETSPGLDSAKSDSKPAPKPKETEKTKGVKTKPVLTNGLSKHVNVKIDLSLLKRIPKLPVNEQIKPSASPPIAETNGSRDVISSHEVKIPKRKLSDVKPVEHDTPKKMKSESDVDSNRTKPRERSSSTNSRHSKDSHRKRSPSLEKDSHRTKRQRHDSENNKVLKNNSDNNKVHDSSLQGFQNGRLTENGVDVVDNGLKPHPCSCSKTSDSDKREVDISRFYDPEPRVPYGPDHYLTEAKRLKHKADSSTDKEAKAFLYVDAVLSFARCGKAIEQNDEVQESRPAFKMYSETLDLLRYTIRNFVNRYTHRSDCVPDKRLSALCMRIQSILYMRLYKLRKDSVMRNVKMVTEHFRGPPKSTQAPSPYTSNTKITGTPSPLSPTPSPSGSVGSVGSNGSNETMTTPSRNGKPSSGSSAMTSPVNVCIPQKIHAMTQQHVLLVNNLVYSQDMWDQAQPVIHEFREFFMDLDRKCGPLTLHSSIVHLFEYIEEGMKCIRESLKAEKSS
ncbi:embryonic hindlimb morphogenesis [Desmophyllum pertusum]|uniref:AF4/FMR2 family member lilli n=1 Tax=Desmophyllum pertusum TaxID=174260 RepID=A0A9W9YXE8_9CNID|nr:embryonic hindlimb morphogenesis [Desmophyllum pertusum]